MVLVQRETRLSMVEYIPLNRQRRFLNTDRKHTTLIRSLDIQKSYHLRVADAEEIALTGLDDPALSFALA